MGEPYIVKDSAKDSSRMYFDYGRKAKDISLDDYEDIYRIFCKAYDLKTDEHDIKRFRDQITLRIMNRTRPEGLDYRPIFAGSKSNARIFITPREYCTKFHCFSYDNHSKDFEIFHRLMEKRFSKNGKGSIDDVVK